MSSADAASLTASDEILDETDIGDDAEANCLPMLRGRKIPQPMRGFLPEEAPRDPPAARQAGTLLMRREASPRRVAVDDWPEDEMMAGVDPLAMAYLDPLVVAQATMDQACPIPPGMPEVDLRTLPLPKIQPSWPAVPLTNIARQCEADYLSSVRHGLADLQKKLQPQSGKTARTLSVSPSRAGQTVPANDAAGPPPLSTQRARPPPLGTLPAAGAPL
eukprot:TRINITY_DN84289_c0_g1_i1.p1 TRINITY_DN84289_c0_g1~~TRINITY_DN84289_c0_g1_i1.p1  ORF type:complete len:218 (+),score=38.92 TRINITY_DN84289_c0_g1_i1:26-679(+)